MIYTQHTKHQIYQMSSTQQHIVLRVDDKVVYDSAAANPAASAATTTPTPAAAAKIDVKN